MRELDSRYLELKHGRDIDGRRDMFRLTNLGDSVDEQSTDLSSLQADVNTLQSDVSSLEGTVNDIDFLWLDDTPDDLDGYEGYVLVVNDEEDKIELSNKLNNFEAHTSLTNNPHEVTASQVDAQPKNTGSSLPSPGSDYRGEFFTKESSDGDKVYVCIYDGSEYKWKELQLD